MCQSAQSGRVSTRQFDLEMGPGVRTVRHAPTEAPSAWLDAPTHDGVWWVWDGREVFSWTLRRIDTRAGDHWSYSVNGTGSFGLGTTADLSEGRKFQQAPQPAPPAPVARFAHPAQMFTPFSAPALEPMPDEPEDLP